MADNKSINTLVPDIYTLLSEGTENDEFAQSAILDTINGFTNILYDKLSKSERKPREVGRYWARDIGIKCLRKLWYSFHRPDSREPLLPHVLNKFMFGDIIEESVLCLAALAGHDVRGLQQKIEWKIADDVVITGRIDAIVDNVIVDVKSTSSFGFKKYRDAGNIPKDADSFGYREQIGVYLASIDDPSVNTDRGYFLLQDKTLGHLAVVEPEYGSDIEPASLKEKTLKIHKAVSNTRVVPERAYEGVPDGKSGNKKLSVECSYCDFKHICWPNLRTFQSYKGPVYLTEVKRVPRMVEITNGKAA